MDLADISYIVPYRSDHGHRDRIWEWCRERLAGEIPEMEILLGADDREGPFCRAIACNKGVSLSARPVVVIGDADVVFSRQGLIDSLQLLEQYRWVMGYTYKKHLSREFSEFLLREPTDVDIPSDAPLDLPYGENTMGGTSSCVVIRRADFLGFDERFIGWNYEDQAFAVATRCLVGTEGRAEGDLFHLWHPYAPGVVEETPEYLAGKKLFSLYQRAKDNPVTMRKLVK